MDFESTIFQCAVVAADFLILGAFYKLYRHELNCLKSLQEAKIFEINSDLPKTVKALGGKVPYAVISGNIRALAVPLQSHYLTSLRGVIYERVTTEKKLKWSPLLQIWDTFTDTIHKQSLNIPFGLYGGGFFKKQTVEVIEPLSAQELVLSTVYDDCKSSKESFSELLLGLFQGDRTLAVLDVEYMLLEETPMTAVGKLVLESDKVKIVPPGDGLTYFLTPFSFDSLIQRIKNYVDIYRLVTVLWSIGTIALVAYFSKKKFIEIKRQIIRKREIERGYEARRQRILADSSRHETQHADDIPKCVICLTNSVEMMVLECGHLCYCLECSAPEQSLCPICRGEIQRLVPVFFP